MSIKGVEATASLYGPITDRLKYININSNTS